ncbi:MAG: DUF1330 domain-containing protein [Lautropia sp.]|nr:MAG: DUF1330 domain-containing protein [Pseudomonadota bacterium]MBC6960400.1 DUF1330 domain-containing protein [Lautropia sp.]MCL4702464.1 DUF1330 domain-containing protein [Burkholderiaceae bacterium]MDL1908299.1 DUF1330 domain-containing protein [Betaproteobacteria bacterium PRO1]MEB2336966.1 DUF1330 domain-containing protein [Burkholderiales bacterium]
MPAYVITDIKVTDPQKYEQYMALSPAAIAAAGGRFVVRGGQHEVFEGNWQPNRLVVVEFPSLAAARAFYDSARYREAREKRAGATEFFNMVVVQGVEPA